MLIKKESFHTQTDVNNPTKDLAISREGIGPLAKLVTLDFDVRFNENRVIEIAVPHNSKEFHEVFEARMHHLQQMGVCFKLEKIETEAAQNVFDIQLDMVYEYTSRQLGLSWSFETEYDYGWGQRVFPSQALSHEALQVYQHLMSGPDDKDFVYKLAQATGGDPKKIMEELQRGDWVEEDIPGEIRTKHSENFQQTKHFWEL